MKPAKENNKRQARRKTRNRPNYNAPREDKDFSNWKPITALGQKVKSGEITDIEDIFQAGLRILEPEIVDILLPNLEEDLLLIGQAKGKFGGGKRRIFRQTQKKTREGNKIKFTTCAVVGNKNGYIGIALGKSKETVPARDKAKRKARLNLMRIRRGCGSWETDSREPNSIPFAVKGKCGSVKIQLMPAPRGKGLCVEKECAKILSLAGIKDIWSKTQGQTKTKLNLITALLDALTKLSEFKIKPEDIEKVGIVEGKLKGSDEEIAVIESVDESEKVKSEGSENVDENVEVPKEETKDVEEEKVEKAKEESTETEEKVPETKEVVKEEDKKEENKDEEEVVVGKEVEKVEKPKESEEVSEQEDNKENNEKND